MFQYHCLNPIAEKGLGLFDEDYKKTEELGCHLRFDYIPWGDERSQINMAIASGEYDFISNGNFSDYYCERTVAECEKFWDSCYKKEAA